MTQRVVVIGHADADGHLIAEQVRRNLELIESFDVTAIVDPARTKDHKAWMQLESFKEIDDADLVFFVDIMFAPATFDSEASALVDFVRERPEKKFFLIDHHPLPLRRLGLADNLHAMYRPDVFECAIGPRSGMMIVAALCEGQGPNVAEIKQPFHDVLARGIRRAAALGGELPGAKLLALLQSDRWDALSLLANDDAEYHRLPRGRRPSGQPWSSAMTAVNQAAETLLAGDKPQDNIRNMIQLESGRTDMAYDLDIAAERFDLHDGRRVRGNSRMHSKDLEAIVTLLEIAALSLTVTPESTFTIDELVEEARKFAGTEIDLSELDVKIVLKKSGFLIKIGGREYRLR
ncbi:MAG TPA: hypothetical protein VGV37_26645 [Aliidongia sp.]|uniref:hypothetical protein n=1 Tax=Aliidongia sp. TaxID=1914230 RepID=UPI002DDCE260|nr:hypothetical protein [Aliidongia sp.]HEV2678135.1 hypothetical protein [Aliidongia sp.]